MRPLLLLLALALPAAAAKAAGGERQIGYLYVEANEGGSSGGHVALRFDDEVFHFQYEGPGVLRLHRDDAPDFLFRYALLENRGVRESRVAVDGETFDLLRDEFDRRLLIQDAQFGALDGLRADVELIAALATGAPPFLAMPGFGYFPADGDDPSAASPASSAVRECVRRRHGTAFIETRRRELSRDIDALRPEAAAFDNVVLAADAYPGFAMPFSTRYRDLLAAREALRLLSLAPRLQPGTYRELDGQGFDLSPAEERNLRAFSAALAADICALTPSSRPDWGTAVAVGLARLGAVELSLERSHWVVLDAQSPDAKTAAVPAGRLGQQYLDVLEAESLSDFARARSDMVGGGGFREVAYSGVEGAANRLLESQAARRGRPLRLQRGIRLPSRPGRTEAPLPRWTAEEASTFLQAAAAGRRRLEEQLSRLYRYDVVRRNCVSESFDVIAASFARLPDVRDRGGAEDAIRSESRRRLGGHIETGFNVNFIPLAAEAAVAANYRVVERREVPSYRRLRLAQLQREEPAWRVWLRESNTVTSETYRPGADDSSFLFFADGPVALRPFLGAANLVFALGDGVLGLATLPVAGPQRLIHGVRGAFFSLPELAFVNVRKGTTSFVERHWSAGL